MPARWSRANREDAQKVAGEVLAHCHLLAATCRFALAQEDLITLRWDPVPSTRLTTGQHEYRKAHQCSGQKQRKQNLAIGSLKQIVRKGTRSSRTKCIRTDPTGARTVITMSTDPMHRWTAGDGRVSGDPPKSSKLFSSRRSRSHMSCENGHARAQELTWGKARNAHETFSRA